eukprot:3705417-Prymnesium_polylepis.1
MKPAPGHPGLSVSERGARRTGQPARRFPMGSSNVGTWWSIRIKSPGLARRRNSAQSHPA